jgi:hypothetical protein
MFRRWQAPPWPVERCAEMRRIGILLALAGAVAFGGCGESSSGGDGGGASQNAQKASCRPAPKTVMERIEAGLTVDGGGKLRNGYAVRSGDFKKVYMVAADIQGPGLGGKDDVGVWSVNSLGNGGSTYAVDSMAQEFSDWGDADKTDAAITASDDGVDEARSCAESA